MDDKYLQYRLDYIDATLEAIIKRQGALGLTLARIERSSRCAEMLQEPIDDWLERIEKLQKEYKDERD